MQLITDIVRRKPAVKPKKTTFDGAHKALGAVLRSSGAKIHLFIGFVLVLAEVFLVTKLPVMLSSLPSLSFGIETRAGTPLETASLENVVASLSLASTSTAMSSYVLELPEIKPDLLPTVELTPSKPTSAPASTAKKSAPQPTPPKPVSTPTIITAKSLIDATTISLIERHDGPYIASLETNAGTYGKLKWDLSQTKLKVGAASFSISYSCNPFPEIPPSDAFDQNPMFAVKTTYTCSIGLAPTVGNDVRAQSKEFAFKTNPGQLVVKLQPSMNTVLRNDSNFGGFIFRNDDSDPVMVTDIYFDISYKGLSTDNPTVLRFENPVNQSPFADYPLNDMALDPAVPYGHSASDVHVSLFFTIPGSDQKMLPVNALGVHKLGIYGVDPTIAVTLRKVITSPAANKVVLSSSQLSWSCIVPLGAYDPSNPTGAYATGRACQQ